MADKEYIERGALEEKLNHTLNQLESAYGSFNRYVYGFEKAVDIVKAESVAADVVEVVRCSECRHLRVFNEYDIYAMCTRTGRIFLPFKKDTRKHFCSDGERKDGAENAAD